MTADTKTNAWALVEVERRRDRTLRRVSIAAWAATFVVVAIFAVIVAMRVSLMWSLSVVGALDRRAVFDAAMPLVLVIGVLSLLVAVLATVGIFLRLRTASLAEIRVRLAAIEAIMAGQGEEGRAP
jgi:hypothetical protein